MTMPVFASQCTLPVVHSGRNPPSLRSKACWTRDGCRRLRAAPRLSCSLILRRSSWRGSGGGRVPIIRSSTGDSGGGSFPFPPGSTLWHGSVLGLGRAAPGVASLASLTNLASVLASVLDLVWVIVRLRFEFNRLAGQDFWLVDLKKIRDFLICLQKSAS